MEFSKYHIDCMLSTVAMLNEKSPEVGNVKPALLTTLGLDLSALAQEARLASLQG